MGLPHFILLYVDEPQASAEFYARLLDRKPLNSSPNFVMFELSPDLRLGLWARRDVEPAPAAPPTPENWRWRLQPTKRSKRSAPIGSAKAPRFCKSRPPWTSAGPSWSRTPTDIGFGCSAPRLEVGSWPRSGVEACFCRSSRAGCIDRVVIARPKRRGDPGSGERYVPLDCFAPRRNDAAGSTQMQYALETHVCALPNR